MNSGLRKQKNWFWPWLYGTLCTVLCRIYIYKSWITIRPYTRIHLFIFEVFSLRTQRSCYFHNYYELWATYCHTVWWIIRSRCEKYPRAIFSHWEHARLCFDGIFSFVWHASRMKLIEDSFEWFCYRSHINFIKFVEIIDFQSKTKPTALGIQAAFDKLFIKHAKVLCSKWHYHVQMVVQFSAIN